MHRAFRELPGSVTSPKGFLASGVFCDIKRLGTGKGSNKGPKRDLAIILSEVPATAAGMFTTNQVCAAPVKVCIDHLAGGIAQAIVVNSGNANACTGLRGLHDARAMAADTAKRFRMPTHHVLVASTGRIGVLLPMPRVRAGIAAAATSLSSGPETDAQATEAIMTSDTRPKQVAVEIELDGKPVRIGGICKGAGMIQPGMSRSGQRPAALPKPGLHATMLGFITTDAQIDAATLANCLETAVANSFNRITVDGDMSTNDSVVVLANGLAGNKPLKRPAKGAKPSTSLALFQAALNHVCLSLARMIVRDGEGVHRVVTVKVTGAESIEDADFAARSVGNSPLVKTSWHGGDPNFGRIMDALGYSRARIEEDKVDIAYSAPGGKKRVFSVRRGRPTSTPFRTLCEAVAPKEFELHINLNLGKGEATLYAADLTEAYVDFNKGDVTDPASLGG